MTKKIGSQARMLGDRQATSVTPHHTPYLSPSRFSLYDQCPGLYKRRYVDRIVDPPTIDMEYGQAIHAALDAQFKGGDGELVFLRELKQRLAPLVAAGADPADWLIPQGISLIAGVARLGWAGESEQKLWWIAPGFIVPIHGVVDLWMPEERVVVDWKTTQRPWSEKTAERYAYQRVIYTQAKFEEINELVTFRFVPLGAYPGGRVQVVDATPTATDVARVLLRAREIHRAIEAQEFTCTCSKHVLPEAA